MNTSDEQGFCLFITLTKRRGSADRHASASALASRSRPPFFEKCQRNHEGWRATDLQKESFAICPQEETGVDFVRWIRQFLSVKNISPWLVVAGIVALLVVTVICTVLLAGGFSKNKAGEAAPAALIKEAEVERSASPKPVKVASAIPNTQPAEDDSWKTWNARRVPDTRLWEKFSHAPDISPWPTAEEWKVEESKDASGKPVVKFSRKLPQESGEIRNGRFTMDVQPGPLSVVGPVEPLMLDGKPFAELIDVNLEEHGPTGVRTLWSVTADGRKLSEDELAKLKPFRSNTRTSGKSLQLQARLRLVGEGAIACCGAVDSKTSEDRNVVAGGAVNKGIFTLNFQHDAKRPPVELLLAILGGPKESVSLPSEVGASAPILGGTARVIYELPRGSRSGRSYRENDREVSVCSLDQPLGIRQVVVAMPHGRSSRIDQSRSGDILSVNAPKAGAVVNLTAFTRSARVRLKLPPLPDAVAAKEDEDPLDRPIVGNDREKSPEAVLKSVAGLSLKTGAPEVFSKSKASDFSGVKTVRELLRETLRRIPGATLSVDRIRRDVAVFVS